jgi:hypothetical protein
MFKRYLVRNSSLLLAILTEVPEICLVSLGKWWIVSYLSKYHAHHFSEMFAYKEWGMCHALGFSFGSAVLCRRIYSMQM